MGTQEKGGNLMGSSSSLTSSSKRQRFYIELKPDQTNIISWKKLLREAKGSSVSGPHSSCSALATHHRVLDDSYEVDHFSDSFARNERLENIRRETPSTYQRKRKRSLKVDMTKVEGDKYDNPSTTKLMRQENMSPCASAKIVPLLDKGLTYSRTSPMAKNHLHDVPMLTYTKKSAGLSSKPRPRDASVFPLPLMPNALQKNEICSEKSTIKAGCTGDQNFSGKWVPSEINPRSRKLMDEKKIEVSFRSRQSNKTGGRREVVDVVVPGFNPILQHPFPRLRSPGVLDHHKLRDPISRGKSRREVSADEYQGHKAFQSSRKAQDNVNTSASLKRIVGYPTDQNCLISSPLGRTIGREKIIPHEKEQKQRPSKKTNMKNRFSFKQECDCGPHNSLKRPSVDRLNGLNRLPAPAPMTCKSWS